MGVSPFAYAPNGVAALVGWGTCSLLAGWAPARSAAVRLGPWIALAAIAATFLGPGLEGVHRWLPIGPLRLDASAALAPWLLLGLASGDRGVRERSTIAVLAAQFLHVIQPDAAQATALALGAMPILASRQIIRPAVGLPVLLALVGAAVVAWFRIDPLAPVRHVEGVLAFARDQGVVTSLGALLALLLALVPLAWPLRSIDPTARAFGAGAVLYLCGAIAATVSGRFPVPLLGAGAAPVLGWYGLALVVRIGAGSSREGT